jgi:hypothetical protein
MSRRAVFCLFLVLARSAAAYDSQCFRPSGEACESGPDAAQNRWLGPSAEHRLIWEHTRLLAGLPAAVSDPVTLDVFTGITVVSTGAGPVPSLAPVAFLGAANVRRRELTIGELAQLPDF